MDSQVVTFERVNESERPYSKVTEVKKPSRWNIKNVLGHLSVRSGIGDALVWPQRRRLLEAALREVSPDVVHAHFGTTGAMIRPVAERLKIPLVVTFYGNDASEVPSHALWRAEYGRLWKTADVVTVLSQEMKETVNKIGCPNEKIEIVHLSRDLQHFEFRFPSTPVRRFLSVGRLTEKKGHFDVIKAFENVFQDYPEMELYIIGDGPRREKLKEIIDKKGLNESVQLIGEVPNYRVAEEMKEADAFILCSKESSTGDREGTPTVLIEAQAVGLPCIATRHAGIPEMIPKENQQFLSEEGCIDSIKESINKIINLDKERLRNIAKLGRAKVEESFNLKKETIKLKEIYKKIYK